MASSLDACTLDACCSARSDASRARLAKARRVAQHGIVQRQRNCQQTYLDLGSTYNHYPFLDPYPIVLVGGRWNGITVFRADNDEPDTPQGDDEMDAEFDDDYSTDDDESSAPPTVHGSILARDIDSHIDAHSADPSADESEEICRIQSVPWMADMTVWQSSFPARRYAYDKTFSLLDQIHSPTIHRLSQLRELEDWPAFTYRSHGFVRLGRSHDGRHLSQGQRMWDFWDSGTSLLAAHVGHELDYVGIRLQDDRCHGSHVVVDAVADTDSIHTVRFASDRVLATVHDKYKEVGSFIKFWDLRQMQTALPSSLVLPSFLTKDSCISQECFRKHQVNCQTHRIHVLPDGKVLCWFRFGKLHLVDPYTGQSSSITWPGNVDFHPAMTNRPAPMFAAYLEGHRKIVTMDWDALWATGTVYDSTPPGETRRRDADGNGYIDASTISTIRLDFDNNYGKRFRADNMAMNEDGTMFLLGSSAADSLQLVRAGKRET